VTDLGGGDRLPLEDRIPPEWAPHVDDLASAPVVLVIGAAEAGKTTFTAWLANQLHARRHRVGIVDADVGQSEIGPPATVGLGVVRAPLTRASDAETVAFEFIGVTSPGRRPWQVAEATGRLVATARTRVDRVVVDTSGFIAGGFAAAMKQRKIAAVDPDVVVAIQGSDECEPILRGLATRARPRVLRLPAVRDARPRSPAARRRHRESALARYFADARTVTLDATRVAVRSLGGDHVPLDALVPGTLVALRADDGTLALGVLEGADSARGRLIVKTPRAATDVAAVTIGAVR
jgi:polynucleotide 5'-hydroxyl-kinase GRC3/NOL9